MHQFLNDELRQPNDSIGGALGWMMHDVLPEELRPADHIYRWGSPVHSHHGIVLEILEEPRPPVEEVQLQDRIVVVHFSLDGNGQAKVHSVTLRQFQEGSTKTPLQGGLKRARYGCPMYETLIKRSGTCYSEAATSPEKCLDRARLLLGLSELKPYDLSTSASANCEHFAFWCSTGQWRSAQVESAKLLGAAALLSTGGVLGWCTGIYLWSKLNTREAGTETAAPDALAASESFGTTFEDDVHEADASVAGGSSAASGSSRTLLQVHLPDADAYVAGNASTGSESSTTLLQDVLEVDALVAEDLEKRSADNEQPATLGTTDHSCADQDLSNNAREVSEDEYDVVHELNDDSQKFEHDDQAVGEDDQPHQARTICDDLQLSDEEYVILEFP